MQSTLLSIIMIMVSVVATFAVETTEISRITPRCSDSVPEQRGAFLKLIDKNVDLGEIYTNAVRYGKIRFVNAGDSALVLKSVRGNCGCTVVEFDRDSIMPDSVGAINVKFDSHGRPPGKFRKMIRIRSNSSRRMDVAFISGTIVTP